MTRAQVAMSATCDGGFGLTRSSISDSASHYVTADRPETTAVFHTSPETNPNLSDNTQNPSSHIYTYIHTYIMLKTYQFKTHSKAGRTSEIK